MKRFCECGCRNIPEEYKVKSTRGKCITHREGQFKNDMEYSIALEHYKRINKKKGRIIK